MAPNCTDCHRLNIVKREDDHEDEFNMRRKLKSFEKCLQTRDHTTEQLVKCYEELLNAVHQNPLWTNVNARILKCCMDISRKIKIPNELIEETINSVKKFAEEIWKVEANACLEGFNGFGNRPQYKLNHACFLYHASVLLCQISKTPRFSQLSAENFDKIVEFLGNLKIYFDAIDETQLLTLIKRCFSQMTEEGKKKLAENEAFLSIIVAASSSNIAVELEVLRDLSAISGFCADYIKKSDYKCGHVLEKGFESVPTITDIHVLELLRNGLMQGNLLDGAPNCSELEKAHRKYQQQQDYSKLFRTGGPQVFFLRFLYAEKMYIHLCILTKIAMETKNSDMIDIVRDICYSFPNVNVSVEVAQFQGKEDFMKACLISRKRGAQAFGLLSIWILQVHKDFPRTYVENSYEQLVQSIILRNAENDQMMALVRRIRAKYNATGESQAYEGLESLMNSLDIARSM